MKNTCRSLHPPRQIHPATPRSFLKKEASRKKIFSLLSSLAIMAGGANFVSAQDAPAADAVSEEKADAGSSSEDLAKQLANPIASLISVPFQSNFDFGGGPNGDGNTYLLNFQPVIPFSLNDDWNLITRTIIPTVEQKDVFGTPENPSGSQSGLSDTIQSFFLSPTDKINGWIVGVGPAGLYPTASHDLLGTGKWGLGPTAVALKQTGGWTYGALVNQIWSVGGDSSRDEVNQLFLQPFLSYTTKQATTFTLNSESTYKWEDSQALVPINVMLAQVVTFGSQPVQFQLGGRYYADGPSNGPEWGLRFVVTLLFPK